MSRAGPIFAVVLAVAVGACGDGETVPSGGIRLTCDPDDASVFVDENYVGRARAIAAAPVRLAPGTYRLEVSLEGYFPHYEEVRVRRRVVTVEVTLRPRPE